MDCLTSDVNSAMPQLAFFDDDESRWQAVQARNPLADLSFVYAVRTTKIFCRPTCKARLARRANVRFYNTGEEARENGFRACKRCKPEVLGLMPEDAAVQKIRAFMREQQRHVGGIMEDELGADEARMSLGQMAKKTGLSKWHFHRVFKKCVGLTPVEYLRTRRDGAATAALGCGVEDIGDLSWLESFNLSDVDFGNFDDSLLGYGDESTEGSSTAQTGRSPLSLDDLFVWPEDIAANN